MTSSSNKKLNCNVVLLDGASQVHQVQKKSLASEVYNLVFNELKLTESDYFGLEYTHAKTNVKEWLDKEKNIVSQVGLNSHDREVNLRMKVKFYTADPSPLDNELTRYYFAMQIKQDLVTGRLSCSENTAVLLAAYIVQSELGDFYHKANNHDYLKHIKLLPNQTDELEYQIADYHKTLKGSSVADAEYQMLEVARKCDMYGVVPYSCQSSEGLAVQLAVTHSGIHIIANNSRLSSYIWVKIRKLGFKRKKFLIKLFTGDSKSKADRVAEFTFPSRDAAKSFWKLSIEHHSFFRKLEIKPARRGRHPLLSRGSSFRYNGRTQTQLVEQRKSNWGQSTFERSMSLRSCSAVSNRRLVRTTTFPNRQELGVMTLDRSRPTRINDNLAIPSVSQVTLESRYSGCYETAQQEPTSQKQPLSVSQSLSAISLPTKSTSKSELKPVPALLPRIDTTRDTNRDSMAVVQENQAELERIVEQINSDLSSAQVAKEEEEEQKRKRNVSTSSIERFLTSAAQPLIPPVHKDERLLKVPLQNSSYALQKEQDQLTQKDEIETLLSDSNLVAKQVQPTAMSSSLNVDIPLLPLKEKSRSNTDTVLKQESERDSSIVLDLDADASNQQELTGMSDVNVAELTVNDVLDSAGDNADDTLSQFLEDSIPTSLVKHTNKADERSEHSQPPLNPKDSGDEHFFIKTDTEFSQPSLRKRGRVRSRKEKMDNLEGLSQLAERVLRSNEENRVKQSYQEASAPKNVNIYGESNNQRSAELSELDELFVHFDTITQQQKEFQQRQAKMEANKHDLSQPPSEKATRKPLIRPAFPELPVSKERLLAWGTETRRMADSGIDIDSAAVNARRSGSDGYSTESDDSVNKLTSPTTPIANSVPS